EEVGSDVERNTLISIIQRRLINVRAVCICDPSEEEEFESRKRRKVLDKSHGESDNSSSEVTSSFSKFFSLPSLLSNSFICPCGNGGCGWISNEKDVAVVFENVWRTVGLCVCESEESRTLFNKMIVEGRISKSEIKDSCMTIFYDLLHHHCPNIFLPSSDSSSLGSQIPSALVSLDYPLNLPSLPPFPSPIHLIHLFSLALFYSFSAFTSITHTHTRYHKGIEKLTEAKREVSQLSQQAKVKRHHLQQKTKEADEALAEISKAVDVIAAKKNEAGSIRESLTKEEVKIKERVKTVMAELSQVQPMIDRAKSSVNEIPNQKISEVRTFKMPPKPIQNVLEGVLCLLGYKDTTWGTMKSFLAKAGMKKTLISLDAASIRPSTISSCRGIIHRYSSAFDPEQIERVSSAVAPLAAWVVAMVDFAEVSNKVQPLREEGEKAERALRSSRQRLGEIEVELDKLTKRQKLLQNSFKEKTTVAAEMRAELKVVEEKLQSASSLLSKLASEEKRWGIQAERSSKRLMKLSLYGSMCSCYDIFLTSIPQQ
ncbi:putative multi-domain containing protein, partial [Aduncisulcus paluster]